MKFKMKILSPTVVSDKNSISSFDLLFDNDKECRIIDIEGSKLNEDEIINILNYMKKILSMKRSDRVHRTEKDDLENLRAFYKDLLKKGRALKVYNTKIEIGIENYRAMNKIIVPMFHKKTEGEQTSLIPYIPGSSVKGSIRKAMAYNLLKNDKYYFNEFVSCMSGENKKARRQECFDRLFMYENYGKHYDAKLDVLRFLEVSDFIPDNSYKLSLLQMSRLSSKNKIIQLQAIMISAGTFYGDINYVSPPLKLRESVNRKIMALTNLKDISSNEDVEKSIIPILQSYYGRKGNTSCEGKAPIMIGFGTGAEMKGITELDDRFIRQYANKKNKSWPPKTHFSVNGKYPGQVCLEVI
ncbi:MAG: type III-A CRISPR-associated RAMP protein Csm5 [Nitrososphaeria archaeon]